MAIPQVPDMRCRSRIQAPAEIQRLAFERDSCQEETPTPAGGWGFCSGVWTFLVTAAGTIKTQMTQGEGRATLVPSGPNNACVALRPGFSPEAAASGLLRQDARECWELLDALQ